MAEEYVPHDLTRREALKRGATVAGALVWATPVVQAVGMSRAFANDTSPIQDCCAGTGRRKVASILMQYRAENCSFTSHNQASGKVTCIDYGTLPAGSVYIVATDKVDYIRSDGLPHPNAVVWFQGIVAPFGTFLIDSGLAGRTELKGETYIHVFPLITGSPDYANELQKVGFHTSCSQPLTVGNQFGASRMVACTALAPAQTTAEATDADNCCKDGEGIGSLTLQYKGWDREVMVVAADTDTYLSVSGEPKPNARVWFQGVVVAGGSFTLNAPPGEVLGKSTWLHVSDPDMSETLETVLIPTSCDQPIRVGDLFGPFDLQDCSGPTG